MRTLVALTCACGNEFKVEPYRADTAKFCSMPCLWEHRREAKANAGWIKPGERKSPETEFVHGERNNPAGEIQPGQLELGPRRQPQGERPHNWKGDKVGYVALHAWVKRMFGLAERCEKCGSGHAVGWANLSWEYRRDRSDWAPLCQSCHLGHDAGEGWGRARELFGITPGGNYGTRIS